MLQPPASPPALLRTHAPQRACFPALLCSSSVHSHAHLSPLRLLRPGLINVDFADVRSVMTDAGPALMGIGRGFGKTRARDAALAAVSSPLLDFPIERAMGVVFTITGTSDMSLQEVNEVAAVISGIVADDANIIFGTSGARLILKPLLTSPLCASRALHPTTHTLALAPRLSRRFLWRRDRRDGGGDEL